MFGLSLLQLYWGFLIARAGVYFASLIAQGTIYDKTQGERDPDAPIKFYQFRKRLAVYYFCGLMVALWIGWNLTWSCLGWSPSDRFTNTLAYFAGTGSGGTDALHVCLAQCLWEFHVARRYYESLSISIFSGRQAWSPVQATFVFLNKMAASLTIVADLGPFDAGFSCFALSSLSWRPFIAIPLFLWATKIHHKTHQKLANLRKNRAGHVVTSAYKMPKGEWFDVVSSPHYFAEMLIYLSIGILLGCGACTWWFLTVYVIIVNVLLGYSTHTWYLKKFADTYPKDRKMLIPYIY